MDELKQTKKEESVQKLASLEQEINRLRDIIENDKRMSPQYKSELKDRIKEIKRDIFEEKHPILSSVRDIFVVFAETLSSISNQSYSHDYGDEGYSREDEDHVRDAMNEDGPVGAARVRAEIEEREIEECEREMD